MSLDDDRKHEFLKIVFSNIEPMRGEFRLKLGDGNKFGRKIKAEDIYFFWNEPFATLATLNLIEIAKQWHETYGKEMGKQVERMIQKFGEKREKEEEETSLTKTKEKKASPFP